MSINHVQILFIFLNCFWLQALSELHDQIPPFPRALAMKIIEEELGSPVETIYSNISEEAVAAASFGQVRSRAVNKPNVQRTVCEPFGESLFMFIDL